MTNEEFAHHTQSQISHILTKISISILALRFSCVSESKKNLNHRHDDVFTPAPKIKGKKEKKQRS